MLSSNWWKGLFKGKGKDKTAERESQKILVETEVGMEEFLRPNPGTVILIVDDSKTVQIVLAKKLQALGYQTLAAYDGDSGVAMASLHKPSLVLMDVVMPGISGFHATRDIRASQNALVANVPIIVMSGNAQATEEFWSRKIGANDFMVKPFTDNELFGRIEKLLYPDASQDKDNKSPGLSAA